MPRGKPLGPQQRDQVVTLYTAGASLATIMNRIGCSTTAVYGALERAGIPRHTAQAGQPRTSGCEV
jgi:hypothetical protein